MTFNGDYEKAAQLSLLSTVGHGGGARKKTKVQLPGQTTTKIEYVQTPTSPKGYLMDN